MNRFPLDDYLFIVKRYKYSIASFFFITMLVVMGLTFLQKPVYRASATVQINIENPNVLSVRDEFTLGQASYVSYQDYFRTQLEIIRSRNIAKKVLSNLKLSSRVSSQGSRDPVNIFLRFLLVEPVRDSRLVKIHYEAPDPKLAARIANEVAFIYCEENLIRSITEENLSLLKNEYIKLQTMFSDYKNRYKDKHPKMVRLKEEIGRMEETMTRQIGEVADFERRQLEPAHKTQTASSEDIFKQLKEASVLGGVKPNNVRVVDVADVPLKPVRPKKLLNFMLSLIFGLLGGAGLAFVWEYMNNTIRGIEDFAERFQSPLMGYVPAMKTPKTKGARPHDILAHRYRFIEKEPHSPVSEAFRLLRTTLLFSTNSDCKVTVVTSPSGQDGKTTLVSNLGIAISQIDKKILIVDADMRKSKLHVIFGVPHKPGLSEFLTGKAEFEAVVKKTGIANLWVIPGGEPPHNPSELLNSPRVKEFLKIATARFDTVLIDTPPIIAISDGIILSGIADKVITVIENGKTPKRVFIRMLKLLSDVQAKFLGTVLNNVPLKEDFYYSQYYHRYYASYYHKEESVPAPPIKSPPPNPPKT